MPIPGLALTGGAATATASNRGDATLHGDMGLHSGDGNRGFVNNITFGDGSIDASGAMDIPRQYGWLPWALLAVAGAVAFWFLKRKG